jgi:hypothetical protein
MTGAASASIWLAAAISADGGPSAR